MAEEYAAKMSRKTDAELLLYLRNRAEYREEAVLAALDEAERRQLSLTEFDPALMRAELGPAAAEQQAAEVQRVAALTKDEKEPPSTDPGPTLYSPVTITLFSAFFSLLAGGALLIMNFRTLGRKGAISKLVLFLISYLLLFALIVRSLPQAAVAMIQLANLPPIIAYNLWFWPRYVGVQQYQSRGWLAPFILCMVVSIILSMLLMPYMLQQFAEMGIPVK
jgi:hypothetical protein